MELDCKKCIQPTKFAIDTTKDLDLYKNKHSKCNKNAQLHQLLPLNNWNHNYTLQIHFLEYKQCKFVEPHASMMPKFKADYCD